MKKCVIIALLLAFALYVAALSGCANRAENDNDLASTDNEQVTSSYERTLIESVAVLELPENIFSQVKADGYEHMEMGPYDIHLVSDNQMLIIVAKNTGKRERPHRIYLYNIDHSELKLLHETPEIDNNHPATCLVGPGSVTVLFKMPIRGYQISIDLQTEQVISSSPFEAEYQNVSSQEICAVQNLISGKSETVELIHISQPDNTKHIYIGEGFYFDSWSPNGKYFSVKKEINASAGTYNYKVYDTAGTIKYELQRDGPLYWGPEGDTILLKWAYENDGAIWSFIDIEQQSEIELLRIKNEYANDFTMVYVSKDYAIYWTPGHYYLIDFAIQNFSEFDQMKAQLIDYPAPASDGYTFTFSTVYSKNLIFFNFFESPTALVKIMTM